MKRLVLAACLLLLPAVARADGDYRFELTPEVSYHFGGSFDASSTSGLSASNLDLDSGFTYGLTFDIPMSSNLQLELLGNRQRTSLKTDNGIFGPSSQVLKTDITYVHVGLCVQFGRPAVTPYFVGSLGATEFSSNAPGASSDNRFSASFGAGVKVFFTPFIGMRLEGRAFWTDVGAGKASCDSSGNCINYRDYLSQGQATVGLIFAW